MNHVVTKPMTPLRTSSGRLEVHQVPAWQDNLIWLLVAKETGEAAIIDGPEAGPVIAALRGAWVRGDDDLQHAYPR